MKPNNHNILASSNDHSFNMDATTTKITNSEGSTAFSNAIDLNSTNTVSTSSRLCCSPRHNDDEDLDIFNENMSFLSPLPLSLTPITEMRTVTAVLMMPDSSTLLFDDQNYNANTNGERHNDWQRMHKKQRRNNSFPSTKATSYTNSIHQNRYYNPIAWSDDISNNNSSSMMHRKKSLLLPSERSNIHNLNDCISQRNHGLHRHQPHVQLLESMRKGRRWSDGASHYNINNDIADSMKELLDMKYQQHEYCNKDGNDDLLTSTNTRNRATSTTNKKRAYENDIASCQNKTQGTSEFETMVNKFNWMEDSCNSSVCTNTADFKLIDRNDNVDDSKNMICRNKEHEIYNGYDLNSKSDWKAPSSNDRSLMRKDNISQNNNTKHLATASFLQYMDGYDNKNDFADYADCHGADIDDATADGAAAVAIDAIDAEELKDLKKMDLKMKDLQEQYNYLQFLQTQHPQQTKKYVIRSSSGLDPLLVREQQGKASGQNIHTSVLGSKSCISDPIVKNTKLSFAAAALKTANDGSYDVCVGAARKVTSASTIPFEATSTFRRRSRSLQQQQQQQLLREMINWRAFHQTEGSLDYNSEQVVEDKCAILDQKQQQLSSRKKQVQHLKSQIDALKQEVALHEEQLLDLQLPRSKGFQKEVPMDIIGTESTKDSQTVPSTTTNENRMINNKKILKNVALIAQVSYQQQHLKGASLTHVYNETDALKAQVQSDQRTVNNINTIDAQFIEKFGKSSTQFSSDMDCNVGSNSEIEDLVNNDQKYLSRGSPIDSQSDETNIQMDDAKSVQNVGDIDSEIKTQSDGTMPKQTLPIVTKTKQKKKPYVKRCKSFPERFMEAIKCLNREMEDVFAWLPDKKSFVIVNQDRFLREIIQPPHFPITNYGAGKEERHSGDSKTDGKRFDSFVRKLNRWGYRRLGAGTGLDCFYHPLFRYDHPIWAKQIQQVHHQQLMKMSNNTDIRNDPNDDTIEGDVITSSDDNTKAKSLESTIGSMEEKVSVLNGTTSDDDNIVASTHHDPPSLEGLAKFAHNMLTK